MSTETIFGDWASSTLSTSASSVIVCDGQMEARTSQRTRLCTPLNRSRPSSLNGNAESRPLGKRLRLYGTLGVSGLRGVASFKATSSGSSFPSNARRAAVHPPSRLTTGTGSKSSWSMDRFSGRWSPEIDRHRRTADHRRMPASVTVPESWVASVGRLALPPQTDRRLQVLMDRSNEGEMTSIEREELEALVEWSESISLVRAEALQLLGRRPE